MSTSLIPTDSARKKSRVVIPTENYTTSIAQNKVTKFLEASRFLIGTGTAVSGLTSLAGFGSGLLWLLTGAGSMSDVVGLSSDTYQAATLGGWLGGAAAFVVFVSLLEERGTSTEPHIRNSGLSIWWHNRKLKKENRITGWRPRSGAPKLTEDELTYPRWAINRRVVDGSVTSEGTEDMCYEITKVKYQYVEKDKKWEQCTGRSYSLRIAVGDEEKLVQELHKMTMEVESANLKEYERYISGIADETERERMRLLAEGEREQHDQLYAERKRHARERLYSI